MEDPHYAFELSNVEISLLFVDRFSLSFHMTQHAKRSFESARLESLFWLLLRVSSYDTLLA